MERQAMTPTEKASAVVSRLIRLTKENHLQWVPHTPLKRIAEPNETLRAAYATTSQGQGLVVYESWTHDVQYDPDTDTRFSQSDSFAGLVVLTGDGDVAWRFPHVSGLWELFEAAQYQAGNIDSLLDGLLGSVEPTAGS